MTTMKKKPTTKPKQKQKSTVIKSSNGSNFKSINTKGHAARWEEMYSRLVAYKNKNGHCHVPNQYKFDQKLANWVATQRRQYKKMSSSSTVDDRNQSKIQRLLAIEFDFSPKDPDFTSWESRFNEYVIFKNKHGGMLSSIDESLLAKDNNSRLLLWISAQREQYKLTKKGYPSSHLTNDRIDLLNKVGFVWDDESDRLEFIQNSKLSSNFRTNTSTNALAETAPPPTSSSIPHTTSCSNMDGVVSVLQQCINTLSVTTTTQQREKQHQRTAVAAEKQRQQQQIIQQQRQHQPQAQAQAQHELESEKLMSLSSLILSNLSNTISNTNNVIYSQATTTPPILPLLHKRFNKADDSTTKANLDFQPSPPQLSKFMTTQQLLCYDGLNKIEIQQGRRQQQYQQGNILSKVQRISTSGIPPHYSNMNDTLMHNIMKSYHPPTKPRM